MLNQYATYKPNIAGSYSFNNGNSPKSELPVLNDSDFEEENADVITANSTELGSESESKRSSATSGVGSSEEKTEIAASAYNKDDIAKILRTRKRLRQTLKQQPEVTSLENRQNDVRDETQAKKRSFSKRYGTFGRRSNPKSPNSASSDHHGNNRFSFRAPASSLFVETGSKSVGFSYNTVGRRRSKDRSFPMASESAEAANDLWNIKQSYSSAHLDNQEPQKSKRKSKSWSFRRLLAGESHREKLKEEKKATIRLQRNLDSSFEVCQNDALFSGSFNYPTSTIPRNCSISQLSTSSNQSNFSTSSNGRTSRVNPHHILPEDDVFLSSAARQLTLEERIMSELKPEDKQEVKQLPPRKKGFKNMFKSFSFSNSATLQRKKRDKSSSSSSTKSPSSPIF